MAGLLTGLEAIGSFIGAWFLVSLAAAAVITPWLRRTAAANAVHSVRDRASDWARELPPAAGRIAAR